MASSDMEHAAMSRVAEAESSDVLHEERIRRRSVPCGHKSCCKEVVYLQHTTQPVMHLADRLLRAYPGILTCDSERALLIYRRVTPPQLILENWKRADVNHGCSLKYG